MKCFRRSTSWCAEMRIRMPRLASDTIVLVTMACALVIDARVHAQTMEQRSAQAALEADVRDAIVTSLESRMGPDVQVTIDSLTDIRVAPHTGLLVAAPDQTAREGRPSRFTISSATGS